MLQQEKDIKETPRPSPQSLPGGETNRKGGEGAAAAACTWEGENYQMVRCVTTCCRETELCPACYWGPIEMAVTPFLETGVGLL
jgi:hypothetical protein